MISTIIRVFALLILLIGLSPLDSWATTASDLVTRVRRGIGETSSGNSRFTDAEILDMLTQGTQVVGAIAGGVEAMTKLGLGDNQSDYALPTGFYAIKAVLLKKPGAKDYMQLTMVDPIELKGIVESGGVFKRATRPIEYTVFDDTLKIAPTIENPTGDTLHVLFFKAPSDIESTAQVTELPQWTDELVVLYAIGKAAERDFTVAEFQTWWMTWNQIVTAVLRRPRVTEQVVPQQ